MKYYYIYYYINHLDYPEQPYFTVKLDHEPTKEEITENRPLNKEIDGYCIKYRYETTIEGELLVSKWQIHSLFRYFKNES